MIVTPSIKKRTQATLLIVDDSPQDISLLSDFLRNSGVRLVVAFDGREGYQKACVVGPDLILMDVRMPRTDGYAACRLLKADSKTQDIPVIFLSGCDELDERLQALHIGGVDFITKPFAAEEVLARINIHLRLSRRNQEKLSVNQESDEENAINTTVQAAMDVLLHDIGRPPSLVSLAHQVGTNERRLTELFRAETGMPVFAWLREQRFLLACRLLEETELDIQQVSDHVGYGSAGNFTTMFRERQGVTPREYRQSKRSEAE